MDQLGWMKKHTEEVEEVEVPFDARWLSRSSSMETDDNVPYCESDDPHSPPLGSLRRTIALSPPEFGRAFATNAHFPQPRARRQFPRTVSAPIGVGGPVDRDPAPAVEPAPEPASEPTSPTNPCNVPLSLRPDQIKDEDETWGGSRSPRESSPSVRIPDLKLGTDTERRSAAIDHRIPE